MLYPKIPIFFKRQIDDAYKYQGFVDLRNHSEISLVHFTIQCSNCDYLITPLTGTIQPKSFFKIRVEADEIEQFADRMLIFIRWIDDESDQDYKYRPTICREFLMVSPFITTAIEQENNNNIHTSLVNINVTGLENHNMNNNNSNQNLAKYLSNVSNNIYVSLVDFVTGDSRVWFANIIILLVGCGMFIYILHFSHTHFSNTAEVIHEVVPDK
ncbi:hypothetical protein SNEBB_002616 [Seison nebaliae]|nr:hypothetical protein SNEBB_002616 [Seison nebaliae]